MHGLGTEKWIKDLIQDSITNDEITADTTFIDYFSNSRILDQLFTKYKIDESKIDELYTYFNISCLKEILENELEYKVEQTKSTSEKEVFAYYRSSRVKLRLLEKPVFRRIFPSLILNHASIQKIHGYYIKNSNFFLISDSYEKTLYEKFQNRPAKPKIICEFLSIISFFSYSQCKNFESLLISPKNIFLNEDGSMVLDDLKIFNEFNKNEDFTADEVNKKYLSPEQLIEQTPNHKSHVWTLGCVLYFLVTGKNPYFNVHTRDLVEWVVFQGNEPSDVDSELYRKFQMIFRKVFVLKPKKRPTLSEFYIEVEELIKKISNQI